MTANPFTGFTQADAAKLETLLGKALNVVRPEYKLARSLYESAVRGGASPRWIGDRYAALEAARANLAACETMKAAAHRRALNRADQQEGIAA